MYKAFIHVAIRIILQHSIIFRCNINVRISNCLFLHNTVDCGEDDEVMNLNGTQDSTDMTHGSIVIFTCASDMCNYARICDDGTWGGDMLSCDGNFYLHLHCS